MQRGEAVLGVAGLEDFERSDPVIGFKRKDQSTVNGSLGVDFLGDGGGCIAGGSALKLCNVGQTRHITVNVCLHPLFFNSIVGNTAKKIKAKVSEREGNVSPITMILKACFGCKQSDAEFLKRPQRKNVKRRKTEIVKNNRK